MHPMLVYDPPAGFDLSCLLASVWTRALPGSSQRVHAQCLQMSATSTFVIRLLPHGLLTLFKTISKSTPTL